MKPSTDFNDLFSPVIEKAALIKHEEYEIEDIPVLIEKGWLKITEIGSENTYFDLEDGSHGFVKGWKYIID